LASRRVYFAVFGSGLGHAVRTLEIARLLPRAEYKVRYSSSGQGLHHLQVKGEGGQTEASPPLDVEWAGGGFSSHKVLPRFPFTLNAFLKQLAFERYAIERFDPDVAVSDSKLSVVFAAKSKRCPVITMLNQFNVLFPPRFRRKSGIVYERTAGEALGLMWSLSDRVLMTDLPPPYTIGEENLSASSMSRIAEFVGFTVPRVTAGDDRLLKAKEALALDGRPLVFCPISGPDATKGQFADTLLRTAGDIARRFNFVVSMGYSGGSAEPRRLAPGVWLYDWCPIKDELFQLSTVVVARAGLSTIAQCIYHRKPAVLVPIHNHPEQISNAEKFGRLGLGRDIRAERLTPQVLLESLESLVDDTDYMKRLGEVNAISNRYNGVEKCAEIIRSFT